MKKRFSRGREAAPDDASVYFGDPGGGPQRADRKERQLCRQVQEAIGEALSALEDEVLSEVYVCAVEPAPDASRLAVILRAPASVPPDLAGERLARVSGYLRSEVAAAITRKRTPTLIFEVLPPEEGGAHDAPDEGDAPTGPFEAEEDWA